MPCFSSFPTSSQVYDDIKVLGRQMRTIFRSFYINYDSANVTTQQLVLVAAVERLPVYHHSAEFISFPLGSLGPLWCS